MIAPLVAAACSFLPPAPLECIDVPNVACERARAVALRDGLFLEDDDLVRRVVVRPTESTICSQADRPLFDVEVYIEGSPRPVVVTLGETPTQATVVCTY